MDIGDIFFAIGIIILSVLLVFVVYDDIMNPYPSIEDISEMNVTEEIISENGTTLVSIKVDNNTVNMDSSSKTKIDYVQSSDSARFTQKLNNVNNLVQSSNQPDNNVNNLVHSSNSQNNNVNKDIKTFSEDLKHSDYPNNLNNRITGQNEPSHMKNMI